jgi:hypothetical protein
VLSWDWLVILDDFCAAVNEEYLDRVFQIRLAAKFRL